MSRSLAAVVLLALAGSAAADGSEDELRAAQQRAAAGDPGALDALEALGGKRPITIWTDDAWVTAARLAEQQRDFVRAQRDLEQAVTTTSDEAVRRRAENDLVRLAGVAGEGGQWSTAAAAHDQLSTKLLAEKGDPHALLYEFERVVDAAPGYPRASIAMVQIAQGWEREGETARAASWLVRARTVASGIDRERASAELARLYIRARDITAAREAIQHVSDARVAAMLRDDLAVAETRTTLGWLLWAVLAVIAAAAVVELRRGSGSWRTALRRLVRPPVEVLFYAPIAAIIVVVAYTGNPLVARAVLAVAIVGLVVGWLSGALLDGRRASLARTLVHALVAVIAVASASWLAIDKGRMIDLVVEKHGPGLK